MSTPVTPAAGSDPFDPHHLCRYLSECSPQPIVATEGPAHVIRYHNPAFAGLAGKPSGELTGRPFDEAVPGVGGTGRAEALDRVFRTGAPEKLLEQEHRCSPPAFWSYTMWAVLGADDRPAGVVIQVTEATEAATFRRQATAMNEALVISSVRQHELTEAVRRAEAERREMEAQVFRAQKMESLGVLAGGIAHDLNNLLTPVIGYTELAADVLPPGSPAAPMLAEVATNARRAADLVDQVLAYTGKGTLVAGPVDLSALVRDMTELLGAAVAVKAPIGYELAPDLPTVSADAAQLRQVVMNLVTNAAEAVDGTGGRITVRTGAIPPPPAPAGATGPPPVPSVFLEVDDTGSGITAPVIERIFEPFFTTKFTGRGLGLAVVQGVARAHNGALQVTSSPGRGSTFRLVFPGSANPTPGPAPRRRTREWRGSGTVLIIDDEKQVRDVTALALKRAGFTVLQAGDGRAGTQLFRDNLDTIVAVVTDLTMPHMGGLEAIGVLRGVRPDLPIVLVSGFSAQAVDLKSDGDGITRFVQKPFSVLDLLAAVRDVLGQ